MSTPAGASDSTIVQAQSVQDTIMKQRIELKSSLHSMLTSTVSQVMIATRGSEAIEGNKKPNQDAHQDETLQWRTATGKMLIDGSQMIP